MSHTYAHLYGLRLTGLRFFTGYGPWSRPDMAMWRFADAILSGKPIQVFNYGRMRRDFTYADDVVKGVIAVSDRPPATTPPHASSRPELPSWKRRSAERRRKSCSRCSRETSSRPGRM
jgi:UDP-glucuronate 4-epimerase